MRVLGEALLVVLLGGCVIDGNPCPAGLHPDIDTDRCVAPDAGMQEPDSGSSICSDVDLERWTARIIEPGLVRTTQECAVSCALEPRCVGSCVAETAGLAACSECVQANIDCAVFACRSACSNGTDLECRACLCDARCNVAFDECARVELSDLLCDGVHGRPAAIVEHAVTFPFVMRRKSATGFTRTTAFIPEAPSSPLSSTTYVGAGWTHVEAFSLRGVEYLLEFMGACGRTRCATRISPVLVDGSLGHPVWRSEWDLGWDVFASFEAGGSAYLLQYKSGRSAVEGLPRGAMRLLRIRPEGELGLTIALAHEDTWAYPTTNSWSHARAFEVSGTPHLLRYRGEGEEEGEAEILRVDAAADGVISLTRASRDLGWEPGWAIVETFVVSGRWFVLRYATGSSPSLPAGTTRINALVADEGGAVVVGPSLVSDIWSADLLGIHAFRAGSTTYFLRREAQHVDVAALAPDAAEWQRGGIRVVHSESWGAGIPPWDVVTVVRARLWSAP